MQIPIWLTVKNIYKTIFSNFLKFISLPTVVLLILPYINSYFKNQIESFPALFVPYMVCFIPLWIMICISTPLIISLMQKYLITGDNQLSYNKIIPRLDKKQLKYIFFELYIYFYVYLLPQLIPIFSIIMVMYSYNTGSLSFELLVTFIVLTVIIGIIFIRSFIISLNASIVHCYINSNVTKLKFKQLIEVSAKTLIGNKIRIFILTIPIFLMFIIDFFIYYSSIVLNFQGSERIIHIVEIFAYYTKTLTYASLNTHIYFFFKEQFEANLAKITAEAEADIITDNKLLK